MIPPGLINKIGVVDVNADLPTILEKLGRAEALGVVDNGKLVGMLWADRINTLRLSDLSQRLTASDLMTTDLPVISPSTSLDLLTYFLDSYPYPAIPVVEEDGKLLGIISRRDILRYFLGSLRPRTVGGMATPLGVYLTTGYLSAGAGALGLFLTGAIFAIFILAAFYITDGIAYLVQLFTPLPLYALKNSPPIGGYNPLDIWYYLCGVFEVFLFLLFLRLSPLTSYHGAEHKVVNTIEAGEPLQLEIVRKMPKEHPRCGTNLAVFILLTFLIYEVTQSLLLAFVISLLSWRYLGMLVQRYITTKEPSDAHLLNGIKAGEELLRKFKEFPHPAPSIAQRIWNMGILYVIAGYGFIFLFYELLLKFVR
ncbi:DUF1385 domain-containing protein [bacterium]|nr:DUF1385 domain-containing protein [bacterium]